MCRLPVQFGNPHRFRYAGPCGSSIAGFIPTHESPPARVTEMTLPDEPAPAEDPALARDVGERLLTEVKSVAHAIPDRVLRTLRESPGSLPRLEDPNRPLRVLCV